MQNENNLDSKKSQQDSHNLDIEKIYTDCNALLKGHFLLSSGNHTNYYLQSAKVLEDPQIAQTLTKALADEIRRYTPKLQIDCVCAPAIGGIIAGYELARALGVRFIFTERVDGIMELRRGFEVKEGENILICEDIITTGGSALESARCVEFLGANIVGFGALANRGLCKRVGSALESKQEGKLPKHLPFFALADFIFDMYNPKTCSLCKDSPAYKPGSRI